MEAVSVDVVKRLLATGSTYNEISDERSSTLVYLVVYRSGV